MSYLYGEVAVSDKLQKIKNETFGDLGTHRSGSFFTEKLSSPSLPKIKFPTLSKSYYGSGMRKFDSFKLPVMHMDNPLNRVYQSQSKIAKVLTGKDIQVPKINHINRDDSFAKLSGFISSKNVYPSSLKVKNLITKDSVGLNRIKQQNVLSKLGLSKFGDYDKDGVMNILDCEPFNKHKQGPGDDPYDNMSQEINGKRNAPVVDFTTDTVDNAYYEPIKPARGDNEELNTRVDYSKDMSKADREAFTKKLEKQYDDQRRLREAREKLKQKNLADKAISAVFENPVVAKIADTLTGTTQEQRQDALARKLVESQRQRESDKAIEDAARNQVIKESAQLRALKLYSAARKNSQPQNVADRLDNAINRLQRSNPQLQSISRNANTTLGTGTFLSGAGLANATRRSLTPEASIYAQANYGSYLSPAQKISQFTGTTVNQVAPQPTFAPMQQQVQTPTLAQAQANPNIAVYSPASKRIVTYRRGPYRKSQGYE